MPDIWQYAYPYTTQYLLKSVWYIYIEIQFANAILLTLKKNRDVNFVTRHVQNQVKSTLVEFHRTKATLCLKAHHIKRTAKWPVDWLLCTQLNDRDMCSISDAGASAVRLHSAGGRRAGVQAWWRHHGHWPLRSALVAGMW